MGFVHDVLSDYLRGVGAFSERSTTEGNFKAEFEEFFLPLLRSLDPVQREELIVLLAQIALGQTAEFPQRRGKALQILQRLKYPWPQDWRLLLMRIKDDLVVEFNRSENLKVWSAVESQTQLREWGEGPGYALTLYGLILVVGAAQAVADSVEYLLVNAKEARFKKAIHRLPKLIHGLEVTELPPITKERFIEYRQSISRF